MSEREAKGSGGSGAGRRKLITRPVAICLILLAAAGIALTRLWLELASARSVLVAMQREEQIQALINNLSAPSEVILGDYITLDQVVEARLKGWERQGVKTCVVYNHIIGATHGTGLSSDPAGWREYPIANARQSYENEVLNRLSGLCSALADDMEHGQRLGQYFLDNKDDFDKRIRPLLVRLLKTANAWVVGNACKALLAAGDRSDEVVAALRGFETSEDMWFKQRREAVRALGRKYGIDVGSIPAKYLTAERPTGTADLLRFDAAQQVLSWAVPDLSGTQGHHAFLMVFEGAPSSGRLVFSKDTTQSGRMSIAELNEFARPPIDPTLNTYSVVLGACNAAGGPVTPKVEGRLAFGGSLVGAAPGAASRSTTTTRASP